MDCNDLPGPSSHKCRSWTKTTLFGQIPPPPPLISRPSFLVSKVKSEFLA